MAAPGRITFVCCIEQGRLEEQTLLMLSTLRRNGGASGQERAIAVIGRRGPSLAPTTLAELRRLEVELVRDVRANPAPWFNYANKIVAVGVAQRLATTPLVAWLDSDVLIAAEPTGLLLPPDVDFAGRCEFLPPSVVDDEPQYVPYWEQLCALLGTTFDALPVVALDHPPKRVRLSFNSGVFVWRRASRFAAAYRAAFIRLLQSRLSPHDGHFFTADQVILSPVLMAEGMRWQHLPLADHHMVFQGLIDGETAAPHMGGAHVVHYSRSLQVPHRERFLARLAGELPGVHGQVVAAAADQARLRQSPVEAGAWVARLLRALRGARWRWYARQVLRVRKGADVAHGRRPDGRGAT